MSKKPAGSLQVFDYKLGKLVQFIPPSAKPIMQAASFTGEPMVVGALVIASFLKAFSNNQTDIVRAFFLAGVAYGLNTLLKQSLHRRRPNNLKLTTLGIESYSFPSGHAFGAAIFYGLFAYLLYSRLDSPWGVIAACLIAGLIFLIGLSRVYLKTHYPSDVVAGWLLGIISLFIVIKLSF